MHQWENGQTGEKPIPKSYQSSNQLKDVIAEREISELAELLGMSKDEALRRALEEGIRESRLKKSIELYAADRVSVKQAARIAGLSLAEWFEVAREKGLLVQIEPDEIEDEVKALE